MSDELLDLLRTAIHDLRDGADAFARRAPDIATQASDAELRELLDQVVERIAVHAAVLGRTGSDKGGPANLWMAGILDDAERDTETVPKGVPLDVAMIGAIRKALAASIVSYQTANALGAELEAVHDELVSFDAQLRETLRTLTR